MSINKTCHAILKGVGAVAWQRVGSQSLLADDFTWSKIAAMIGVSRITLHRRIRELGLEGETRYSEIDDQELDVFVRTILALLPNSGEVQIARWLNHMTSGWQKRRESRGYCVTSFIYRNKFYFLTSFIYTYIFNENICNKFYITMTFIYRKTSLYLQRFINCMTSFILQQV